MKLIEQENNYEWCVQGKRRFWVHKCICEKCEKCSCPVYKRIARRKKEDERKKFEKEGISRSLLLKLEDRINGNKK